MPVCVRVHLCGLICSIMRCMTPLGVKGHIKVRVRGLGLVLVNLIMEQIKPHIRVQVVRCAVCIDVFCC